MFKIIKWLISLAVVLTLALAIVYFLPSEIKIKGLGSLMGILPQELEEKAEQLILTPAEQREKLIAELEEKLTDLETSSSDEQTEIVQESKAIVAELKDKSGDASITNIIAAKLVDKLIRKSSNDCPVP